MAWAERTPDLTALRDAAQRAQPVALAREQILPVLDGLEEVVAGPGLRRGTTVAVTGSVGVESFTLALAAGASQQGSWTAVVGLPSLGLVAAGQVGVALDRLAVIDAPPTASWGAVVAALTDGFDLVVLDARRGLPGRQVQRLSARVRERGAVLLLVGGARGHRWPLAADIDVRVTDADLGGTRCRSRVPAGPHPHPRGHRSARGHPPPPARRTAPRSPGWAHRGPRGGRTARPGDAAASPAQEFSGEGPSEARDR